MLSTARLNRCGTRGQTSNFLSSQVITVRDRRLKKTSAKTTEPKTIKKAHPTSRICERSEADMPDGRNHKRFKAKINTTVIESYNRSTMIVTNDAAGLTRRSRIGKTTGRTTSPARPINSTAPKPTVVAIQIWLSLAGVNGASSACQRTARQKYAIPITIAARPIKLAAKPPDNSDGKQQERSKFQIFAVLCQDHMG